MVGVGGLLSRGELFRGNCSGVFVFVGIIQGAIVRGQKPGDNCLGRNFTGGNRLGGSCQGENYLGVIIRGAKVRVVIVQGAVVQGGISQG